MTGFEPRSSGIGSNRAFKCATTAALCELILIQLLKVTFYLSVTSEDVYSPKLITQIQS